MPNQNKDDDNLLTDVSLATSLAPPRAPPLGTTHRNFLCNVDPSTSENTLTHHHSDYNNRQQSSTRGHTRRTLASAVQGHHGVQSRVQRALHNAHSKIKRLPHPHISFAPDSGDQVTRWIGSALPIWWQHAARDGGTFRSISDYSVTCSVPSLAVVNNRAFKKFLRLTHSKDRTTFRYGHHPMQFVDFFLPPGTNTNKNPSSKCKGLVFFVHGGAWGSGMPWMYRLCASPFLEANMAVAIVGYRTYPDGNAQDQVDDLEAAAKAMKSRYPQYCVKPEGVDENDWMGVTLMGHSSGSHIALLMVVQRVERYLDELEIIHQSSDQKFEFSHEDTLQFDQFVGLSGVYDISHHFDYESGRGVEELSPMKPACGYTRDSFDHYSPAVKLQTLLSRRIMNLKSFETIHVDEIISKLIPGMLLVHGVEDTTVPFTSTSEASKIIRSCGVKLCEERYWIAGHADIVVELMLDGKTKAVVLDWLLSLRKQALNTTSPYKSIQSRL